MSPARAPRVVANWASVDWTDVDRMCDDLKLIRSRLAPMMEKTTRKSANRVRDRARVNIRALTSGRTTAGYPKSITWNFTEKNGTNVVAEIGPDRHLRGGAQGFKGHLLENGTVKSPPKPHLVPALLSEADHYETEMANEAEKVVIP